MGSRKKREGVDVGKEKIQVKEKEGRQSREKNIRILLSHLVKWLSRVLSTRPVIFMGQLVQGCTSTRLLISTRLLKHVHQQIMSFSWGFYESNSDGDSYINQSMTTCCFY